MRDLRRKEDPPRATRAALPPRRLFVPAGPLRGGTPPASAPPSSGSSAPGSRSSALGCRQAGGTNLPTSPPGVGGRLGAKTGCVREGLNSFRPRPGRRPPLGFPGQRREPPPVVCSSRGESGRVGHEGALRSWGTPLPASLSPPPPPRPRAKHTRPRGSAAEPEPRPERSRRAAVAAAAP